MVGAQKLSRTKREFYHVNAAIYNNILLRQCAFGREPRPKIGFPYIYIYIYRALLTFSLGNHHLESRLYKARTTRRVTLWVGGRPTHFIFLLKCVEVSRPPVQSTAARPVNTGIRQRASQDGRKVPLCVACAAFVPGSDTFELKREPFSGNPSQFQCLPFPGGGCGFGPSKSGQIPH